MRTVKWNPFLSGVCTLPGRRAPVGGCGARGRDVDELRRRFWCSQSWYWTLLTTDQPDDTIIQLTNTSTDPVNVRCFYVEANGHCSNDPSQVCNPNSPMSPCGPFGILLPRLGRDRLRDPTHSQATDRMDPRRGAANAATEQPGVSNESKQRQLRQHSAGPRKPVYR